MGGGGGGGGVCGPKRIFWRGVTWGGMCWYKKKSLDLRSPQVGISAIGKYGSLQPRLQSMADKF